MWLYVIIFGFLQAFLNQHCGELVSVCEAYLAGIILSETGAQNLNEELMVRSKCGQRVTLLFFLFVKITDPGRFLYSCACDVTEHALSSR